MRIEKDFEELLELLNRNKVKYCIIGSFAVAFHAKPRYTKDIDLLIEPNNENAEKILTSLNDFGFGSLNLTIEDFNKENKIIQLGFEPIRIDIVTSIQGCAFEEVWNNKIIGNYGKQKVNIIGFDNLLKNKQSVNRPLDKTDVQTLLKSKKHSK